MLIAQLSDLHVRPAGEKLYDFIDTNGLLARHVAYLNRLEERPDVVVISGDITNCGTSEEYLMARRILSQLDYPTYLLPGNHDDNDALLAAFIADHPYLGTDPAAICYAVDDFPIRLVMFDSSVPGQLYGRVGPARLGCLAELLSEQPERQTICFLHHHPLPSGCLHMDTIRCRDGEQLLHLLEHFPAVGHVFCGHTHRAIFQRSGRLLIASAPSTAHQVPYHTADPDGLYSLEPPSLLMHRYAQETGLVSFVASLAPYDGPFRFACTAGCPDPSDEQGRG